MELKSEATPTASSSDKSNESILHCPLCNSQTEQQFVVVESQLTIKEKALCPSCGVPVLSVEHVLH